MTVVKLNVSLERSVAELLRGRAAAVHKPASRYIADLVMDDARREQDELAAEGYRALSADTGEFAAAAFPLALEIWAPWDPLLDEDRTADGNLNSKAKADSESETTERRDLLGKL